MNAQNSSKKEDNLYKIARAFVKKTNIPVTQTTIRNAFGKSDTDKSLADLTDAFNQWKIESVAVRLNNEQLKDIDFPAIAFLTAADGLRYFVMLTQLKDNQITYFDSDDGYITEDFNSFFNKWGGIILLSALNDESGESNYKTKRREEILYSFRAILPIVLISFCLIWSFDFFMSWQNIILALAKSVGLVFTILLLSEQFGLTNSLLEKICHLNNQTNCKSVLTSKAAKLWGIVSMAEIGLIYFMGSLLVLVLASFSQYQKTLMPYLSIINLLTLPYTLFSVYYQGWKVKSWCPLCIGVLLILWLEFSLDWTWLDKPILFSSTIGWILISCFSIPLASWLMIKELLNRSIQVNKLKSDISRFKENSDLFINLLENGATYDMQFDPREIILGKHDAPVTLTMISGPYCEPCTIAHETIESLLETHQDELRIVIRFAVDAYDDNDNRNKMALHLLTLAKYKPDLLKEALHFWYTRKNLMELTETFPIEEDSEVQTLLNTQKQWCQTVNIQFTPTYFINNFTLPKYYTLEDLHYHLSKIALNQTSKIAYSNESQIREY